MAERHIIRSRNAVARQNWHTWFIQSRNILPLNRLQTGLTATGMHGRDRPW